MPPIAMQREEKEKEKIYKGKRSTPSGMGKVQRPVHPLRLRT
jgi:hypothetical protein